jgi:hypothetical protein
VSITRKRLHELAIESSDGTTYATQSSPTLTDAMSARVRRFQHAACEVSATHITRRLAFHMLLDAGMKALGDDVIKAAKGAK